eukprot:7309643-Alexandrium_andersonii.AAC.1
MPSLFWLSRSRGPRRPWQPRPGRRGRAPRPCRCRPSPPWPPRGTRPSVAAPRPTGALPTTARCRTA